MHECLLNLDVTIQVMEHLAEVGSVSRPGMFITGVRSLAYMARSCQALYEPAMAVLWHTLMDFSPLVMALPSDVYCEEITEMGDDTYGTLCLVRMPTSSEWENILKLAARVRRVEPWSARYRNHFAVTPLSCEVLYAMNQLCISKGWHLDPARAFFPNLRSLCWSLPGHSNEQAFLYVPHLVSQRLETVDIDASHTSTEEAVLSSVRFAFRELVARCSSGLRRVRLDFGKGDDELSTTGNRAVASKAVNDGFFRDDVDLPRLSILDVVGAPNVQHIRCMGGYPNLQQVTLHQLHGSVTTTALSALDSQSLFPSLERFDVKYASVVHTTQILNTIGSHSLKYFSIYRESYVDNHTAAHIFSLCRSLAKHDEGLEEIHLKALYRIGVADFVLQQSLQRSHIIDSNTFSPLLSLLHLRVFSYYGDLAVDLDDHFIKNLASSCPQLEKFWLRADIPLHKRPRVTLAGLIPLADCSKLKKLSLAVDMILPAPEAFQEELESIHTNPHTPQLEILDIHYHDSLNVTDVQGMCRLLKLLFGYPRLDCVAPWTRENLDIDEPWRAFQRAFALA
ncbi:hypothetical protein EIP91_007014 [Steccherinum ochraceum]|uniref:F-box domain-containing protein n=1 Tax=Steccherinum ochraceum TaxID=92696 RepID=A0A4R0RQX4_9APHY|nr:hypothetical protein EIP91_007014 [Steccherinum ochraceum]